MNVEKINRKTIKKIPHRDWNVVSEYKAVYLVPSGLKHESGYMKIAIVGIKENGDQEVCGYPDDIAWDFTETNQKYDVTGMRTDCYYPSGTLHFWGNNVKFIVDQAMSSQTIKVLEKVKNK